MKYRKRPVEIEAVTFEELVAHGIADGVLGVRPGRRPDTGRTE